MGLGEPPSWTADRQQRQQQQFPELGLADPSAVLGIANMQAANGQAPSPFAVTALRVATHAVKMRAKK